MTPILCLSPAQHCDPTLAIAASRAGVSGLFDLGVGVPDERRRDGMAALWRHARTPVGVRWDLDDGAQGLDGLAGLCDRRLPLLLLGSGSHTRALAALPQAKSLAEQVLLEVNTPEQALEAQQAGFDGLVLKGNEAAGWVHDPSSFLLMQHLHGRLDIPWWLCGGVGFHSLAAALLAGAAGVVLHEQLWLLEEAPFDEEQRTLWRRLDGGEAQLGAARPGDAPWPRRRRLVRAGLETLDLGQDILFAAPFAERFGTLGNLVTHLQSQAEGDLRAAGVQAPLAAEAPLARLHGTRLPIVQGPMTRVSDVPAFALSVAAAGALPCVALAVLGGEASGRLLQQTRELLGERPWGVGILGFLPQAQRQAQLEAIRAHPPAFAVIAGGRPSQARELEAMGVASYLHVPSPGLLEAFFKEGTRHFIFEGSECGGHIGPRSSLVLWNAAVEVLRRQRPEELAKTRVLFAGGIHDPLSAGLAAALMAPLNALGVATGILMGTAYLFTAEAVRDGAILPGFQAQALECHHTRLLQSGVGHVTRCADTPFAEEFSERRRALMEAGVAERELLLELERLNVGRLRIAAKGVRREGERLRPLDPETQQREGLYMLGEAATLRSSVIPLEALHHQVSDQAMDWLRGRAQELADESRRPQAPGEPIAVIGMAGILPGAGDLDQYWANIVGAVNAVTEVPPERWDPAIYFDSDRLAVDKIYSKWGGFIGDLAFDPTEYGIPPASLPLVEPAQLLALEIARRALGDAGYLSREFDRERAAVFFAVGGVNDRALEYMSRSMLPQLLWRVRDLEPVRREEILQEMLSALPSPNEDSFPGTLGNVVAGRIANRFDLGGANFTVDAACAASLAALDVGIEHLRSGRADLALVGAVDGCNNIASFLSFARTQALSPQGSCRPFDDGADGIALGEGCLALVLKRLSDAERDGDRVLAVIRGIGASSDGRNRSLTAPHPAGQMRALRRAYADAGVSPAGIGLVEAHGTGTALGDKSEIETLTQVFKEAGVAPQAVAVGSVKSMIGHTKIAAGLAGLAKCLFALHHRRLPPTLGVTRPNRLIDFEQSPFYINTQSRPWLAPADGAPRRAAVSAFGFGGTNFHLVLEEYRDPVRPPALDRNPRPLEPFPFAAATPEALAEALRRCLQALGEHDGPLAEYARGHWQEQRTQWQAEAADGVRLVLPAASLAELRGQLGRALAALESGALPNQAGCYGGRGAPGGVALLFPGQGSQRAGMLLDLALLFPAAQAVLAEADRRLAGCFDQPLSRLIYPLPAFDAATQEAQARRLAATEVTQPALAVAEAMALQVLTDFGILPDALAGHSFGEFVALHAAGVFDLPGLLELAAERGRLSAQANRERPGVMAAVRAAPAAVTQALGELAAVITLANHNAPDQVVIAGPVAPMEQALERLRAQGLPARRLAVGAAFHTPELQPIAASLEAWLAGRPLAVPQRMVYGNSEAAPYPLELAELRQLMRDHVCRPVRFVEQIEAMYRDGVRWFVEAGPGGVLSALVGRILGDRPHRTLTLEGEGRGVAAQLPHLLAQLSAAGVPVRWDAWFAGRALQARSLAEAVAAARRQAEPPPTTWRVNASRVLPWHGGPIPGAGRRPLNTSPPPQGRAPAVEIRPMTDASPARPSAQADTPQGAALGARPELAGFFSNMEQFLQAQREQQRLLERFLETQERVVLAALGGAPTVIAADAGLGRPPVPVLPDFVLQSLRDGSAPAATAGPAPAMPPASPPASHPASLSVATTRPQAKSAPPPTAGDPTSPPSVASFRDDLLQVVSERTGYPIEMLGLDRHLEAELGIDSIKKIEVFGGLAERYQILPDGQEEAVIEQLGALRTLGEIVGWYEENILGGKLEESLRKRQAVARPGPALTVEEDSGREAGGEGMAPDPVRRFQVVAEPLEEVAAPSPWTTQGDTQGDTQGLALVLGEGALATALVGRLNQGGYRARRLVAGDEVAAPDGETLRWPETADQGAVALGDWLTRQGEGVAALLDLSGADEAAARRSGAPQRLFALIQGLAPALQATPGALVACLTQLGGRCGIDGEGEPPDDAAATPGLLKTLAREWPGVRVRCIDLDPALPLPRRLEQLWQELHSPGPLESGVDSQGRWGPALRELPSRADSGLPAGLPVGSVWLITGGARGITAVASRLLAQRLERPRLVILGRTRPAPEPEGLGALADARALRRHLLSQGDGRPPAEVNRQVRDILAGRELAANLDALEQAGAQVEYHPLDVRDNVALEGLIEELYQRLGGIHGVIHGAGVIEDGLLRDKTPQQFERVYATKAAPLGVLARRLRPEGLRHLWLFSSVAAWFGNAGQGDYAAANTLLDQMARHLARRWPGTRVTSIAWGPGRGHGERGAEGPLRPPGHPDHPPGGR
jgi:acyl transferase domain-containing protein/NAD(P)H-dependent flavin oxidoreductase YrpB (nitropropane dioxygenase family)/NAD(P)-dependent dehydrogenase (short-subunit alcohol dehydrogenase family)